MITLDMFGRLLSETMRGIDTQCSSQTGKEENSTKLLSLDSQQVTLIVSLLITTFYRSGFFVRVDDNTFSSDGGGEGGGECVRVGGGGVTTALPPSTSVGCQLEPTRMTHLTPPLEPWLEIIGLFLQLNR